jgi:hypothetical protein
MAWQLADMQWKYLCRRRKMRQTGGRRRGKRVKIRKAGRK